MTDINLLNVPQKEEQVRYSKSTFYSAGSCSATLYFKKLCAELPDKYKEDPVYAMTYGSAIHKGVEESLVNNNDPVEVFYDYLDKNFFSKFDPKTLDAAKTTSMNEHGMKCIVNFENNFKSSLVNSGAKAEVKFQAPFRKGIMTGFLDILMPDGTGADFKTGDKVWGQDKILNGADPIIYTWLMQQNNIPTSGRFDYIFLSGENMAKSKNVYKSGKKKGQTYYEKDTENPIWKYSYPVYVDNNKIERYFTNYVNPLAKIVEQKIYAKTGDKDKQCPSCQYRTICSTTNLPETTD